MWLDLSNNEYTTQEIIRVLEQRSNRSYTIYGIEFAYCVGAVIRLHGTWFQRVK